MMFNKWKWNPIIGNSKGEDLSAYPSEIAVFPTPGSPISTGLFFVLLERIWMHLRISSSLPMTGSSFPAFAIAVKSFPYFSKASYFPSGSIKKLQMRLEQYKVDNYSHFTAYSSNKLVEKKWKTDGNPLVRNSPQSYSSLQYNKIKISN